jgi:hypothetical protein
MAMREGSGSREIRWGTVGLLEARSFAVLVAAGVTCLLGLSLGCKGAGSCGGRAARSRPAGRATSGAGGRTNDASTGSRRGPGDEECDERRAELAGKLDGSFSFVVSPPFVAAGDMSEGRLRQLVERSVLQPAQAMWASYFEKKPTEVITVLLFNGQKSYRHWARKLLGDSRVSYFGYYRYDDRTLVMDIRTGGGTLIHELTHALIFYDFPKVPTWLNEAIASLHEACRIYDERIEGTLNWRLPGLKEALAKGKLRPLEDLVTKRDFGGKLVGLNYAHSRYFALYAQRRKLLRRLYRTFRDTYDPKRPNDVAIIEEVFGEKIGTIDRRLRDWIKKLPDVKPR